MRPRLLLLSLALLVGLVVMARPREAHACGGPTFSEGEIAAAVVVAGAYTGTTIGMGIHDLTSDDPSRGYGVAEAVVHTPIALLFGAALVDELSRDYSDDKQLWLGAFTALHATLAIHGIYTAARTRPRRSHAPAPTPLLGPPGSVNLGPVRGNVTLTPVSDGRAVGGGLGFVGSF